MSDNVERFSARWSPSIWLVTLAAGGLLVCVCGWLVREAILAGAANPGEAWLLAGAAILPLIVLLVTLLYAPRGYAVGSDGIIVCRIGPNVVLGRDRIAEIRRIRLEELGFPLRIWGSGGLFGAFGRFWSRRLGAFRAYVTNRTDLVLIVLTSGEKVLISPGPAVRFLDVAMTAGYMVR